jgi:hypothetical protein
MRKPGRKNAANLFISLFDGYKACYTAQLLIRFTTGKKQ